MSNYIKASDESAYIVHHGILGQKWGVRRYQNKDGTLTDAGKRHIGSASSLTKEQKRENVKKFQKNYHDGVRDPDNDKLGDDRRVLSKEAQKDIKEIENAVGKVYVEMYCLQINRSLPEQMRYPSLKRQALEERIVKGTIGDKPSRFRDGKEAVKEYETARDYILTILDENSYTDKFNETARKLMEEDDE